jgi:hypothetical protein
MGHADEQTINRYIHCDYHVEQLIKLKLKKIDNE